jgi:hypothetical protein
MIFLLVAGALVVGAPILAAILVAAASLREDAERSLAGRPPGKLAAAARRLLSVRTESARAADPRSASGPAYADITGPMVVNLESTGPARPGTARPGPARPGTARPGTARPGPARPGPARPGPALARVPAPRLTDRDQADDMLPTP